MNFYSKLFIHRTIIQYLSTADIDTVIATFACHASTENGLSDKCSSGGIDRTRSLTLYSFSLLVPMAG